MKRCMGDPRCRARCERCKRLARSVEDEEEIEWVAYSTQEMPCNWFLPAKEMRR